MPAAADNDGRRHRRRDAGATVCGNIEAAHPSRQKRREKWGTFSNYLSGEATADIFDALGD